jgi:L-iditol 2-dehydrogenase
MSGMMQGVTKRSAEAGDVGLVEWPRPVARPNNVVLRVLATGVCGTDLHIFRNEYAAKTPVVMGHEVCGRVVSRGEGVDPAWEGRRVVAETFFATCRTCRHCRDGRPNLCRTRQSIGTHVNGAMAPLVEVPAASLHPVPDQLSDPVASLAEPLACVTNSLFGERSYIEPGQAVLIIGPGAIGLLAAQVAAAQGAHVTVRGAERDAARLALAGSLGFAVSRAGDGLPEESFDVVVECAGAAPAYADALRLAARGGRVAQMGLSGRDAALPTDLICYKELTIPSGFASNPRSWERAMRLLESGSHDLAPLITDVASLADWRMAFERSFAADGAKFVIVPGEDA